MQKSNKNKKALHLALTEIISTIYGDVDLDVGIDDDEEEGGGTNLGNLDDRGNPNARRR